MQLDAGVFHHPELTARLVAVRRDLHQHPELGFQEVRTAGVVAKRLGELGIPFEAGIAGTGVLGLIEGALPGPTVLLRADMDALPLPEASDAPYRSLVAGKMHACGHDAHTSMLLGAAEVLQARRHQLPGRVKLCFQPAEEGPGGAEPMIAAGVLQAPEVHYALGLHVWIELPTGDVGILPGPMMAAADTFECRVTSRGGHGAAPHRTRDPILAAAAVLQAWQAVVARETDPLQPAVLSVCQIQGGFAENIIPSEVLLRGTVRTFDDALRAEIPRAMRRILEGVTRAYGCGHEFTYDHLYPATVNDPRIAEEMRAVVDAMGDHLATSAAARPCMGAEDMSYFLRQVPGCFMFLGCARPGDEDPAPHHSNRFDVDEGCLPHGVELLVRGALRLLETDPMGSAASAR